MNMATKVDGPPNRSMTQCRRWSSAKVASHAALLSMAFLFSLNAYHVARLAPADLCLGASSLPSSRQNAPRQAAKRRIDEVATGTRYKNAIEEYVPSSIERYIVEHAEELGYNSTKVWTTDERGLKLARGCAIWNDPEVSNEETHRGLRAYQDDLDKYNVAVKNFRPIPDVIDEVRRGNYDICSYARVHPDGLKAMFPSGQLSLTKSGYVEPLTPPMRSMRGLCAPPDPARRSACPPPPLRYERGLCARSGMMDLDYLVHDYEAMCRNLKPHSRRVFVDLGASLDHGSGNPVGRLLQEYEKFGFRFDHIYAFEMKFTRPEDVYGSLLAEKYFAAYHWINVGVKPKEDDRLNPLHSVLGNYGEDDFVVFKMDVDSNSVELPLARQLLDGGGPNGTYYRLIDQFYFEHHVHLSEMSYAWNMTMAGTIKDSLDLFYGLRERGIPAHFWP